MNLNKNNYYGIEADNYYMSVSQFKSFCKCEAKAMAKLKGEWKDDNQDALLIGYYVHSWSEGTLEEFRKEHIEMFKKDGSIYAKYEMADKMINTLANDELISKVREGQKEVIMTAEIFGVPWKCMIDIYNPDKKVIVDLKTTREIHKKYWNEDERRFQNFIEYYDYLLQMAMYAEIDRINRNSDEYFLPHIIAVSKENVPDKAVIFLGTDFIKDKLLEVEIKMDRVMKVKSGIENPIGCGKCDYCKSIKQLNNVVHYQDL